MQCDHLESRYEEIKWVDWGGEEQVDGEWKQYPSVEDVDLHRYRCTKCGQVFYYSSRARQHFEEGVSFPGIQGLE